MTSSSMLTTTLAARTTASTRSWRRQACRGAHARDLPVTTTLRVEERRFTSFTKAGWRKPAPLNVY